MGSRFHRYFLHTWPFNNCIPWQTWFREHHLCCFHRSRTTQSRLWACSCLPQRSSCQVSFPNPLLPEACAACEAGNEVLGTKKLARSWHTPACQGCTAVGLAAGFSETQPGVSMEKCFFEGNQSPVEVLVDNTAPSLFEVGKKQSCYHLTRRYIQVLLHLYFKDSVSQSGTKQP